VNPEGRRPGACLRRGKLLGAQHKNGQLRDTHGAPVAPGPEGTPLSPVMFPVRTTPPAAKTAGATPEK
jgi:hypothetical protein